MISCGRRLKSSPTNEKKNINANNLHYPTLHIRSKYCHVYGVPWPIITGSALDDWIYWHLYDHAAQKTQPLYCCRGVLPRSFLASSLGADHIENTFHSCRVLLQPCVYWSDAQQWMSFIVVYCCTHYPATVVYQESVSAGTCLSSRCLAVGRYIIVLLILIDEIRYADVRDASFVRDLLCNIRPRSVMVLNSSLLR
jgi:hypothetical protein